jgi:hypothetical protein
VLTKVSWPFHRTKQRAALPGRLSMLADGTVYRERQSNCKRVMLVVNELRLLWLSHVLRTSTLRCV